MEDLSKMKFMEMCIKESLRIYSTVPFIGRELTEECRLGELKIKIQFWAK